MGVGRSDGEGMRDMGRVGGREVLRQEKGRVGRGSKITERKTEGGRDK